MSLIKHPQQINKQLVKSLFDLSFIEKRECSIYWTAGHRQRKEFYPFDKYLTNEGVDK